ncbi:E3 ubiquitin-protein ligase TRIM39-like [Halichoeres trimaculatus]|uniref:E3 ubiquitin-protein ligase TRIM39-like n=1 Tax=Halichoeres trimaculatus TaxID=147232 RepID=UPI003D9E0118
MLASSSLLSEEQFQCSICLDVFIDPATTPCEHNLCKNCLTKHWDVNKRCECPLCKDAFESRPELRVNTFISEMARQVRARVKETAKCVDQNQIRAEDVLCNFCSETKLKALKSCLTCLASYCDTHLEPHHRIPGLKKHELIDPVENLKDRLCKIHDRPLEMFCKTDQRCVCISCTELDHKRHVTTPLRIEYEQKKATLEKKEEEIQLKILERQLKIEQIKQFMRLSKEDADHVTTASVQVFTALIRSLEGGLAQLLDLIEEKHKKTEKQAEGFIKELEEENSKLMKRRAEVEQLLLTEDHLQFLQNFPSLSPAPPTKDWTEVRVQSSYEGTVRSVVAQIEETVSDKIKKLYADVDLKRVQQYAVDVTLNPDTAHPALILSDNKKNAHCDDEKKRPLDSPLRFSCIRCALGETGFSSGRFYYEVQVRGKTRWEIGVARESINRKGRTKPCPMTGLWVIWLRGGNEYKALDEPCKSLLLKSKPQKVGVFVDYDEGVISFYDADTAALIYSFTGCNFIDKLFPIFGPGINDGGKNSAPLIITPVKSPD